MAGKKLLQVIVLVLACKVLPLQSFIVSGGLCRLQYGNQRLPPPQATASKYGQQAMSMMGSDAIDYGDSEDAMKDNKMLHVVYRVGDLDRSVKFYEDVLGMKLLRKRDIPEEKYANAFLGYGTESQGEHFSLEFTYNYGVEKYNLGDAFRYMSIRLEDVRGAAKRAQAAGAKITFGPEDVELGPCMVPDEDMGTVVVQTTMRMLDPDGYTIEVVGKKQRDPVSMVSLNVVDLEKSIKFYQDALGMKLLRKRSMVPAEPAIRAYLSYGDEDDSTLLELNYPYSIEKVNQGDAYGQIAVSTPDVYKAAEHIKKAGYTVARDPGPVPGIGTKITAVRDPDNYKIVLVDASDFEKELE